jgi:hypothetical protein
MSKRTQEQVDALWPVNQPTYNFAAVVTVRGGIDKKPQEVAKQLQPLYEGHEAMAGSFVVGKLEGQGSDEVSFHVVFTRDVCDDCGVVEDKLLNGDDFNKTLTDQFVTEFNNAVAATKSQIRLKIKEGPTFAMTIPTLDSIKTEEQGRDFAVAWQHWQSDQSMSYGELHEWQVFFEQLADKFPNLKDEFKENAIC